jgi:hypothetical protein
MLYFAGITAQLAISPHLFNVGFSDDWCRRNIGLRVAKSLAYANATGFRCHGGRIAQLAQILTSTINGSRHRSTAATRRMTEAFGG